MKILLVVALENEIPYNFLENDIFELFICGMGAVNVYQRLEKHLRESSICYDLIINLGFCGSVESLGLKRPEIGSVAICSHSCYFSMGSYDFIEVKPPPRLQNSLSKIHYPFEILRIEHCQSIHRMAKSRKHDYIHSNVQLVDMELHHIAFVANYHNIPLLSVKFTTDIVPKFLPRRKSVVKKELKKGLELSKKNITTFWGMSENLFSDPDLL